MPPATSPKPPSLYFVHGPDIAKDEQRERTPPEIARDFMSTHRRSVGNDDRMKWELIPGFHAEHGDEGLFYFLLIIWSDIRIDIEQTSSAKPRMQRIIEAPVLNLQGHEHFFPIVERLRHQRDLVRRLMTEAKCPFVREAASHVLTSLSRKAG